MGGKMNTLQFFVIMCAIANVVVAYENIRTNVQYNTEKECTDSCPAPDPFPDVACLVDCTKKTDASPVPPTPAPTAGAAPTAAAEGDGSGTDGSGVGDDGIVGVKSTASLAPVAVGDTTMKVADITGITVHDVLTIGVNTINAEEKTVKSVTADAAAKRQRRAAAVPGTIEFTSEFRKAHAKGVAIEWTVAKAAPKSSAVTTTVGVGIFAMVAALF